MKMTKIFCSAIAALSLLAMASCDLEIRDEYVGNVVQYSSTGLVASGSVAAGTAFEAKGTVDTSNGVSISFKLPATLPDDWTTVVETDNVTVNLSTMKYDGTDIYEAAATATNDGAWDSYKSTACYVSISFNSDGSVQFYKDGLLLLTYASSTTMNDKKTTIGDLCEAMLEDVEIGFTIQYAVSDVYLDVGLSETTAAALYNANK